MNQFGLIAVAAVALVLAVVCLVVLLRIRAALETHTRNARWLQSQMERIENERGFLVFVDYAHTPDALSNVLRTLRELTKRRLFAVFGHGVVRAHAEQLRQDAAEPQPGADAPKQHRQGDEDQFLPAAATLACRRVSRLGRRRRRHAMPPASRHPPAAPLRKACGR